MHHHNLPLIHKTTRGTGAATSLESRGVEINEDGPAGSVGYHAGHTPSVGETQCTDQEIQRILVGTEAHLDKTESTDRTHQSMLGGPQSG